MHSDDVLPEDPRLRRCLYHVPEALCRLTHRRNMAELHSSIRSMRKMIAEINTAYSPSLILLDGIEAFVDRGPMKGQRKKAGLLLSGTDRIAIDAVGLAILKDLGSNKAIMETPIFEQEQISR